MSRIAPMGAGVRQREPRRLDPAFLRWMHHDIPCIACLIKGRPRNVGANPIEAAHQKLAISGRWTEGGGGKRTHDDRCAPLCAWHHRLAPAACDNGQRNFWDGLGIGDLVADLCADLYEAFQNGGDGGSVVREYAKRVFAAI